MALCSIPACLPELTVVVHVAKLGAPVGGGGVGVEDAVLLHQAGTQADALTGVLLTQAPDRSGRLMVTQVSIATILMSWTKMIFFVRLSIILIPGHEREQQENVKSHDEKLSATMLAFAWICLLY